MMSTETLKKKQKYGGREDLFCKLLDKCHLIRLAKYNV